MVEARTHMDESENVDGPEPPVLQCFPDHLDGESLAVVHVRLGRVITEDPVSGVVNLCLVLRLMGNFTC